MKFKPWNENRLIIAQSDAADLSQVFQNKGKKNAKHKLLFPVHQDGSSFLFNIPQASNDQQTLKIIKDHFNAKLKTVFDPIKKTQTTTVLSFANLPGLSTNLIDSLKEQLTHAYLALPTDEQGNFKNEFEWTLNFTYDASADTQTTKGKKKLIQYNFPINVPILSGNKENVEIYLTKDKGAPKILAQNHPNMSYYPFNFELENGTYILTAFSRKFDQSSSLRSVRLDFIFLVTDEGFRFIRQIPKPGSY